MLSKDAMTCIQSMVQSRGEMNLAQIPLEYKATTGKKLSYRGKFITNFEGIPNLEIRKDKKNHAIAVWIGPTKNRKEKGVGVVSQDKVSKTRSNDDKLDNPAKVAVQDATVDIVTFDEALSRRSFTSSNDDETKDSINGFSLISIDDVTVKAEEMAEWLFDPARGEIRKHRNRGRGSSLVDRAAANEMEECALLGHMPTGDAVFLNTNEPFCFATIGVQGAGKSHTISCVLESCLVPFEAGNVVKLKAPMISLVLHWDQNTTSLCESAGLLLPDTTIKERMMNTGTKISSVPKSKAVVLVSPTFYRQRKAFYGDHCTTRPLLFKWSSLTADHIKRIMRINEGDNQLYVASFMDLLRDFQRKAIIPDFASFLNQVREVCSLKGQKGPLDQRIALLESVVAESSKNASLNGEGLDLEACRSGGYSLIIADLTDPLLSKEEVNGIFQVLTEQFRALPTRGGKVLCLDEAHKFMDGVKGDGLSEAIVNVARLMRHDGMRLVVSTQNPRSLAPELLELVTVACLHHFHSPDWWTYLKSKLALSDESWETVLSLDPGDALIFATSHNLATENGRSNCLPLHVRRRITADLGSSKRNSSA